MINQSNSAGYIGYAISLLLVTAAAIFILDVRTYRKIGQHKEWKVSLILGWINLGAGILLIGVKNLLDWMGS